MKHFYKIVEGKAHAGSGTIKPSGFTEYTKGQEPQELLDGLEYQTPSDIAENKLNALLATDSDIPRITEDLIDLLVSKGVFTLNELPADAKNKFNNRKVKRAEL